MSRRYTTAHSPINKGFAVPRRRDLVRIIQHSQGSCLLISSRITRLQYPSGVDGLRYAPSTVAGTMARTAAVAPDKSGRRQGVEPDPNEPEGLGGLAMEHTAPNFRQDEEAAAEQAAGPKLAYDGRLGYDFGRRTRLNLCASPLSYRHNPRGCNSVRHMHSAFSSVFRALSLPCEGE